MIILGREKPHLLVLGFGRKILVTGKHRLPRLVYLWTMLRLCVLFMEGRRPWRANCFVIAVISHVKLSFINYSCQF